MSLKIRTSDNQDMELESFMANQSPFLKKMFQQTDKDKLASTVHKKRALLKVMEYCKHYGPQLVDPDEILTVEFTEWDRKFFPNDPEILYELIQVAEHFELEYFLELSCKALAEWMQGKPLDVVRKGLKIVDDFNPEGEEAREAEKNFAFRKHTE